MTRLNILVRLFCVLVLFPALMVSLSCDVPVRSTPLLPFHLVNTGSTDTIPPYGSFMLLFTRPVADPDSVQFIFNPPEECLSAFDTTHDTVTFTLTQPLIGSTRYTIKLANPVHADDGAVIASDSVDLITAAIENEPNDSRDLADTVRTRIFGSVTTANDTDWFVVADTTVQSFYLRSSISSSIFDLRDSLGRVVVQAVIAEPETLAVPVPAIRPLYVVVYARSNSNGGYYELRSTGK